MNDAQPKNEKDIGKFFEIITYLYPIVLALFILIDFDIFTSIFNFGYIDFVKTILFNYNLFSLGSLLFIGIIPYILVLSLVTAAILGAYSAKYYNEEKSFSYSLIKTLISTFKNPPKNYNPALFLMSSLKNISVSIFIIFFIVIALGVNISYNLSKITASDLRITHLFFALLFFIYFLSLLIVHIKLIYINGRDRAANVFFALPLFAAIYCAFRYLFEFTPSATLFLTIVEAVGYSYFVISEGALIRKSIYTIFIALVSCVALLSVSYINEQAWAGRNVNEKAVHVGFLLNKFFIEEFRDSISFAASAADFSKVSNKHLIAYDSKSIKLFASDRSTMSSLSLPGDLRLIFLQSKNCEKTKACFVDIFAIKTYTSPINAAKTYELSAFSSYNLL